MYVPVVETWGISDSKELNTQTDICCCENGTIPPGGFPSPLNCVWNCESSTRYLLCASAVVCVEVRRRLAGVASLFVMCVGQGSNPGLHLWQQALLPAETVFVS